MKKIFFVALIALTFSFTAKAQFDLQLRWEFQPDSQHPTVEAKYLGSDNAGKTLVRSYFNLDNRDNINIIESANIGYLEFERTFNFWKSVKILKDFSVMLEADLGLSTDNKFKNAFLAGIDYSVPLGEDNKLNLQVLYRYAINTVEKVPLLVSAKYSFKDVAGLEGLKVEGYADFLWEDHVVDRNFQGQKLEYPRLSHISFQAVPQIWYNIGQWINCSQLNVGGQVGLYYDFLSRKGFYCQPSVGVKWEF